MSQWFRQGGWRCSPLNAALGLLMEYWDMTKSDKISKELLEWLGYNVVSIPTSDLAEKKEADFLISYASQTAIVEAKIKEDSDDVAQTKEEALAAGEVAIVEGNLGRCETISGVINTARKQLLSSSDKEHDFKWLIYIATGSNAQTKSEQFSDTIYGSTKIIEGNTQKTCYFYRHADFFRRKEIDAAIVGYELAEQTTVYLALNPYSDNYESLKVSSFIQPFQGNVVDPIELEKQGKAYIPDANVERRLNQFQKLIPSANPIIHHLQEKYKLGFIIPVDFDSTEYSIRTGADEEE
ncbi:hypothetical protein ACWOUW_004312 [Vibrio vulnificus]